MRIARRALLALMLGAPAARFAPLRAATRGVVRVYIGTQGDAPQTGWFDPASGRILLDPAPASIARPSWIIRHAHRPILYVASEVGGDGAQHGSIFALRADPATGALATLSQVDAGGGGTAHLSVDGRSMTLFAANYGAGSVASFPILQDGSLAPAASLIAASGSGPSPRQTRPHAHCVAVDPSGRFLLSADLGTDRLYVHPFDGPTHRIVQDAPGEERHYAAPPGSGPRHFAFHPDGRRLFLINELTADVQTLAWDARAGRLTLSSTASANGPDHRGDSSASEILVSRDGRFVYAGNRAENSLVVFAIDQASGGLSVVQRIASGGAAPWAFQFDPSGRWLLVANQKSDRVSVFAVDRRTGRLRDSGHAAETSRPVSICFLA
jgi:6-phosphogluconolactonase (cycloisomerase 2 family)